MTKIVVALCLCVLLGGAALYIGKTNIAPGVQTKGLSIGTAITTAEVNQGTGVITTNAP